MDCTAARVNPATIGEAIIAWAIIMAVGEYRSPKAPKRAVAHQKQPGDKSYDRGGKSHPEVYEAYQETTPEKRVSPSTAPAGKPIRTLMKVAVPET